MKKYTFYFICFLMAVAVTSCKKEKEEDLFLKGQMTDFHGQKAYIDGSNYSCFRQGETIFVNGRNNCTVSALSNSDRTCTISGAEEASGYYAFYPANMISATDISSGFSGTTVTLPRVQQYVEESGHQVIDNPMAGHLTSPSGTIQFNNLCAVLKLNVFTNGTLDSISVRCPGATLFGSGTVDASTWKLNMDANQTGKDSIVLLFPNRRAGNVYGESYYIVVPEATLTVGSDAVVVRIFGTGIADNTATRMKRFGMTIPTGGNTLLAYNKIHNFANFCFGRVEYNQNCVFTVAPAQNGKPARRVTIANGNLVRDKDNGVWHFPKNPYDNVSVRVRNVETNKYYDYFFCYGTSGWSGTGAVQSYNPSSNIPSNSYNDYTKYILGNSYTNDMTGAYAEADWGWHNTIQYDEGKVSPPHTWRTLTKEEWDYLINQRPGRRWAKASIVVSVNPKKTVNGLIIFQDNTDNNHNLNQEENEGYVEYTLATWNDIFKKYGAVFLPAHGFRGLTTYPDDAEQSFYGGGYQAGFYAVADHWAGGTQTCDFYHNLPSPPVIDGTTAAQTFNADHYVNCFIFSGKGPNPTCTYFNSVNSNQGWVGTRFVLRNEGVCVRLVHDIE